MSKIYKYECPNCENTKEVHSDDCVLDYVSVKIISKVTQDIINIEKYTTRESVCTCGFQMNIIDSTSSPPKKQFKDTAHIISPERKKLKSYYDRGGKWNPVTD